MIGSGLLSIVKCFGLRKPDIDDEITYAGTCKQNQAHIMLMYFAVLSAMSVALGNLIPMIIELSQREQPCCLFTGLTVPNHGRLKPKVPGNPFDDSGRSILGLGLN